ncbi:MAG: hypothetical protein ACKO2G_03110, partial [Verrucomicrobiales bacterium]
CIGNVEQGVILDHALIAFLAPKQGAGLAVAFDQIVFDGNGFEIALRDKPEETFPPRCLGGSGDDMIVPHRQVVEHLVDPDREFT